ncbi:MAG: zinc ribbon domain-containing protein, partial [Candidatus Heimdallarchaeota archaeon]
SGMVTYDGPIPSRTSINEGVVEPDMQLSKPKSQTNTTTQPSTAKPCPYCGEIPIVPQATFCSDCGASLLAAK